MTDNKFIDAFKRMLTMTLALIMVLGSVVPIATQEASAFDGKKGSKYTVYDGGQIVYGSGSGGYSNSRKCDLGDDLGSRYSYCVQPSKSSPGTGTVTVDKVITDDNDTGKWNALRNIVYYSPSYPGYDNNVTNIRSKYYTGNFSKDWGIAHMALSYVYAGRPSDMATWGGTHASDLGEVWTKAKKLGDELYQADSERDAAVPTSFKVFICYMSGVQDMIVGYLEAPGHLNMKKVSNRTAITDSNNCYSLDGAEYTVYDSNGKDLNKVVRQNISTQATRLTTTFEGPKLGKADSKAYIEFDFSGGNSVNVRLRQAWAKLTWQKGELLLGKAWSPFADIPFPYVAGLHTGIPFRQFSRGDQVRFTFKPSQHVSLVAAGLYQTEHKSALEASSNGDIRQNPIPEFHLQWRYSSPTFSAGLLGEFKSIRPATKVTNAAGEVSKTDKRVNSYALGYYAQYLSGKLGLKTGGLYGLNLSDYFQQGGYAVKSVDPNTGKRSYAPSKVTSYWLNISYGKKWAPSLFVGYTKNLGFTDDILAGGDFFGRWQNVDQVFRLAPSLKFSHKQWTIQGEIDYDNVAYGNVDYADHGKVKDTHNVQGVRGLIATTFFF